MNTKVFRVRRISGVAGGLINISEADVCGFSDNMVEAAAHEGRIRNWRNVDTLGEATIKFCRYQFLGEISFDRSYNAIWPRPQKYDD